MAGAVTNECHGDAGADIPNTSTKPPKNEGGPATLDNRDGGTAGSRASLRVVDGRVVDGRVVEGREILAGAGLENAAGGTESTTGARTSADATGMGASDVPEEVFPVAFTGFDIAGSSGAGARVAG